MSGIDDFIPGFLPRIHENQVRIHGLRIQNAAHSSPNPQGHTMLNDSSTDDSSTDDEMAVDQDTGGLSSDEGPWPVFKFSPIDSNCTQCGSNILPQSPPFSVSVGSFTLSLMAPVGTTTRPSSTAHAMLLENEKLKAELLKLQGASTSSTRRSPYMYIC